MIFQYIFFNLLDFMCATLYMICTFNEYYSTKDEIALGSHNESINKHLFDWFCLKRNKCVEIKSSTEIMDFTEWIMRRATLWVGEAGNAWSSLVYMYVYLIKAAGVTTDKD